MLDLRQKLVAAIKDSPAETYREDIRSDHKVLFLNKIVPDPENARYLPAILVEDQHAVQFVSRRMSKLQMVKLYDADGFVLVGKSMFINCLKYGTEKWREANTNIQSILDLSENIGVAEVIQAPTIYPIENSKYQLLTGHRRFFAMVYSRGTGGTAQFKVYDSMPLLLKTKQFQENSSREDLSQSGKLKAFLSAQLEIQSLNYAKKLTGDKPLTVKETASLLGISMGAYDNYSVLTRYNSVVDAYEDNWSKPFVHTKKLILQTEDEYKKEHDKTRLNIGDSREIARRLKEVFDGKPVPKEKPKHQYRFKTLSSPVAVKHLLASNVFELDTGINWNEVDWENDKQVNEIIQTLFHWMENTIDN